MMIYFNDLHAHEIRSCFRMLCFWEKQDSLITNGPYVLFWFHDFKDVIKIKDEKCLCKCDCKVQDWNWFWLIMADISTKLIDVVTMIVVEWGSDMCGWVVENQLRLAEKMIVVLMYYGYQRCILIIPGQIHNGARMQTKLWHAKAHQCTQGGCILGYSS